MWTGIIKGHVTATMKHPAFKLAKILIVQPLNPVTQQAEGLAQIAVDRMGAGRWQKVLVSGDGAGTTAILEADKTCPIRLAVVAILKDDDIRITAS
jgi:ethanolamine utilization protein EutN